MWSIPITATAIAVASIVALYAWGAYRWRSEHAEKQGRRDADIDMPKSVDGSGFELEYLMTAEYQR